MFTLRYWYGLCLAARGEAIEARKQLERAIGIDPTSLLAHTLLARVLYEARQYDEARANCRIAIEREEHFYLSHTFLAHIHRAQGNIPEAMKELELARLYSGNAPAILADIAYTCGIDGEISKALEILQTISNMSKKQFVAPYVFAHLYLGLGNKDNFFRWLEKSYDEKSAFMIFLATDPMYDSIRDDPRFIEMVNKVGYMKSLQA
jgi:tetratricopeptide (TPR) repeat protein